MKAFIEVVSVSLACLIALGLIGMVLDFWERKAYEDRRKHVDPPEKVDPWWFGDPKDGDTFP
jgi:hypothetical protein